MSSAAWSAVRVVVLLVSTSFSLSPVLAGPIHDATKADDAAEVDRLIAAGADVDEEDIAQKTALHWAAENGHMDVVQVLIAKGADVNAKDFSNYTPLYLTGLGNHEAIVKLLIAKGADVNAMDDEGTTVLDNVTRRGYVGIVEMLEQAGAKCGTNFYYAKHCRQAAGLE